MMFIRDNEIILLKQAGKYTEDQLIALVRQRNRQAFDFLYEHYAGALFCIILRIVKDNYITQDILQEVFVSIWFGIETYNADRGKLFTWMRNIARNKSIDHMRSAVQNMRSRTIGNENHIFNHTTAKNQDIIGLNKLLFQLQPEQQSLVSLVYYKGYTFQEASEILDIPPGTLKTRMRRIIKILKQAFEFEAQYAF